MVIQANWNNSVALHHACLGRENQVEFVVTLLILGIECIDGLLVDAVARLLNNLHFGVLGRRVVHESSGLMFTGQGQC